MIFLYCINNVRSLTNIHHECFSLKELDKMTLIWQRTKIPCWNTPMMCCLYCWYTTLKLCFGMLPVYHWYVPLFLHPQPTYENCVSKLCCRTLLKRVFDIFLHRLKRGRGEAQNSNMIACISHNLASYFSSNLELDLRLVTTQHYTLVWT